MPPEIFLRPASRMTVPCIETMKESPTHRLFQTKASSSRIEHLEVPHDSCGNMLLTSIRLESKSVDLLGHPASWSRRIQGEAIRPAHPEAHQTRYRPLNWGKTKLQTGKPMDSEMDCFYICLDIFGICWTFLVFKLSKLGVQSVSANAGCIALLQALLWEVFVGDRNLVFIACMGRSRDGKETHPNG